MIAPEYCRLMARYAQWMNARLFAAMERLPDGERRRERGAFFGSLHETCGHLVWGDRAWLARFTGGAPPPGGFGRGLFADFDLLAQARTATDAQLLEWAELVTPEWLAGSLRYRSLVDGQERTLPCSVAAIHLFNHGTHHRGQITTLMHQAGLDPGVTDLPSLPAIAAPVAQSRDYDGT